MMRTNFLLDGGEFSFEKNGFTAHFIILNLLTLFVGYLSLPKPLRNL